MRPSQTKRNAKIIKRIVKGDKLYEIAEDFDLTLASISIIKKNYFQKVGKCSKCGKKI